VRLDVNNAKKMQEWPNSFDLQLLNWSTKGSFIKMTSHNTQGGWNGGLCGAR
jgi:hypothetical protein